MRPQIDWKNPLSRGLVSVVTSFDNTGAVYDAVTGKREYTLQTGGGGVIDPKLNPTPKGLTLSNRPDKQYYWEHATLHPADQQYCSILAWFRPESFANNGAMPFGSGDTSGSGDHRFGVKQYSGSIQVFVNTSTGSYQTAQLNATQVAEKWYLVVGTLNVVTQELILYIDGVEKVNTALTDTSAINSSGVYKYKILNGSPGDANREYEGDLLLGMVWHDRALTAAEVAEISRNPWQIFKAQPIIGAHQLPTNVDYGMVKVPWTSQPPLGTEIDWGNPITNGLRLADTYQTTHPLDITGLHTGEGGQVSHDEFGSVSDPRGGQIRGLFFDAANTTATRRYSQDDLQAIDALTCLAFYRMRTPTGTEKHYLGAVARSGFDAWRLEATGNSGASYRHFFALYDDTPTFYSTDQAAQYYSTDVTPRIVIGRFERANIFDLWIDGEFYADRTGGAPDITIRSRPDERFQVQGEHLNAGPRDDEFYLSLVWDRALTENEIKSISKNPWQIFKPREIMVPINEDLPDLGTFEKPWDGMPMP